MNIDSPAHSSQSHFDRRNSSINKSKTSSLPHNEGGDAIEHQVEERNVQPQSQDEKPRSNSDRGDSNQIKSVPMGATSQADDFIHDRGAKDSMMDLNSELRSHENKLEISAARRLKN